jgi:hypothetical protein
MLGPSSSERPLPAEPDLRTRPISRVDWRREDGVWKPSATLLEKVTIIVDNFPYSSCQNLSDLLAMYFRNVIHDLPKRQSECSQRISRMLRIVLRSRVGKTGRAGREAAGAVRSPPVGPFLDGPAVRT